MPKGRSSLEPLYAARVDNTLPHCRGEAPRYGTIGFSQSAFGRPTAPETVGAAPGEIRNHFSQSAALVVMRCFMNRYLTSVRKFLVSEDGPTAVEYAVMLALIIVVCLAAIGTIGTNANATFTKVGNSLAGTT